MPDPTYSVAIEFVAGSFTEIGSDALRVAGSGQKATIFDGLRAGRADVLLDNGLAKYSPDNGASPYAGLMKPNKALRIQATHAGSTRDLFNGFVDRWAVNPLPDQRTAHLQASDRVKNLLRRRVELPIYIDVNVGSVFVDVLSAAGLTASYRLVDALNDKTPFAWFADIAPLQAVEELQRFGYYQSYVDAAGAVRIKGRYWGLEGTPVASYVASPQTSGAFFGLDYSIDDDFLINLSRVSGEPRKVSALVNTIAWFQDQPTIPASGFFGFLLSYVDPNNLERDTPATSVSITKSSDWLLNTDSGGGGTDRTATGSLAFTAFGASVVGTLFNGSPDTVYVNKFQARGFSIQRQPEVIRETADASSQNVYGKRDYALASDFISSMLYAKDYADFLVRQWKEPVPLVAFALKNHFPDVLDRSIGDTVHLQESGAAISSRFVIAGMDYDVSFIRGLEHTVTYACELWQVGPWLVLDHADFGKLDSGRQLAF